MLKEIVATMAAQQRHVHVYYLLFALAQLVAFLILFRNSAPAHVYGTTYDQP
jgi:hypothetical protein